MNTKTFTERARQLKPRLFRIAYLSSKRYEDCEDAVQEALIKAWTHRDSLREERYFETWLIRILINECRRIHRGSLTGRTAELTDAIPAPEPADPVLRDALQRLDEKYRVPLVLHHLEQSTKLARIASRRKPTKAIIGENESKRIGDSLFQYVC